jgi:hypothetical protein
MTVPGFLSFWLQYCPPKSVDRRPKLAGVDQRARDRKDYRATRHAEARDKGRVKRSGIGAESPTALHRALPYFPYFFTTLAPILQER